MQHTEELPTDMEEVARRTRSLVLRAMRTTRPKLVLHGHWHRRHSLSVQDRDNHVYRVEGLASDQEGDSRSWGVLELPGLEFHGGEEVELVAVPERTRHRDKLDL